MEDDARPCLLTKEQKKAFNAAVRAAKAAESVVREDDTRTDALEDAIRYYEEAAGIDTQHDALRRQHLLCRGHHRVQVGEPRRAVELHDRRVGVAVEHQAGQRRQGAEWRGPK